MSKEKSSGYMGRRRSTGTRKSVMIADRFARFFITLGGLGTIIAIGFVCVFLAWKVVPLFEQESFDSPTTQKLRVPSIATNDILPIRLATDEYLNLGWLATNDAKLRVFRVQTGELLSEQLLYEGNKELTAWSISHHDQNVALGFADGTIQIGRISFATSFYLEPEVERQKTQTEIATREKRLATAVGKSKKTLAAEIASLNNRLIEVDELEQVIGDKMEPGESRPFLKGIVQRTPQNQYRLQEIQVALEEPVKVEAGTPIRLIDISAKRASEDNEKIALQGGSEKIAMLLEGGELRIASVRRVKNFLTKKVTTKLRSGKIQTELPGSRTPSFLKLAGLGDSVFLACDDGYTQRFDARRAESTVLAEEVNLTSGNAKLTSLEFLIGKTSLVAGDSQGNVSIWFRIKPEGATTTDGAKLIKAHQLPGLPSAVTSITPSARSRMVAVGYQNGDVQLCHVTSDQQLAVTKTPQASAIDILALSPKDDLVLALSDEGLVQWKINAPHPEITMASIFMPVWYEGFEKPTSDWQSSSGTDDFEPKYGLWPLIFGTIKATIYSMIFATPLALLAAIFSSEFLHPKTKSKIKPTIEIMASLPSVVLGFLAALVFAPMIEDVVSEVLAAMVMVPLAFLFGAYLWQFFPTSNPIRERRLTAMIITFGVGLWLAWISGPAIENWLFAGDIKAWLDGQIGDGVGGWMILLFPASAIGTALVFSTVVTPRLRAISDEWTRTKFVTVDLIKFIAGCAVTLVVAYSLSKLLTISGWDPRGSYIDTFTQRNALVVGFIMGFAVIPIIYTISDDALSAVPESLRAGSLGAGATPWQTAVRVIIPTATSGLFSAIMIGLGRAVGETMIVLMATGNTPVTEWNMFNGFRTLSANIAVETPEAVRDSSHYRMLFLAALTLFAMTFILNTIAEIVRQRFRKRAFQL